VFKSKAQQKKFDELLKEGKITKEIHDKWTNAEPSKLPERALKKRRSLISKPIRAMKDIK
jgi:hypothetical protein